MCLTGSGSSSFLFYWVTLSPTNFWFKLYGHWFGTLYHNASNSVGELFQAVYHFLFITIHYIVGHYLLYLGRIRSDWI